MLKDFWVKFCDNSDNSKLRGFGRYLKNPEVLLIGRNDDHTESSWESLELWRPTSQVVYMWKARQAKMQS